MFTKTLQDWVRVNIKTISVDGVAAGTKIDWDNIEATYSANTSTEKKKSCC